LGIGIVYKYSYFSGGHMKKNFKRRDFIKKAGVAAAAATAVSSFPAQHCSR
jgi:TAT (twin-arginine translocation) pathway signal sequence.